MRLLTFRFQTEPGFRLNVTDLALLAALAVLTWWCRAAFGEHGVYLLPAYVGLCFFQFCNVFRIGNRLERFWYPVFLGTAAIGMQRPEHLWVLVLAVCEPLKLALIVHRMRAGDYHGVFHRALASAPRERP